MHVTVYTLPSCMGCNLTKRKLTELGIPFEEQALDAPQNAAKADELRAAGHRQAPIVVLSDGPFTTEHNVWHGYRPDLLEQLA